MRSSKEMEEGRHILPLFLLIKFLLKSFTITSIRTCNAVLKGVGRRKTTYSTFIFVWENDNNAPRSDPLKDKTAMVKWQNWINGFTIFLILLKIKDATSIKKKKTWHNVLALMKNTLFKKRVFFWSVSVELFRAFWKKKERRKKCLRTGRRDWPTALQTDYVKTLGRREIKREQNEDVGKPKS